MKTLTSILLSLLLVSCGTTVAPPVQRTGSFVILEYSEPGTVARSWEVSSFQESALPRTVTFTHAGKVIVLRGSYQINEFTP